MLEIKDKPDVRPSHTDEGDHDKFSHYVESIKLADAMIYGTPLKALCGKKWVPTRDGLKFPVCPECKEVFDGLPED